MTEIAWNVTDPETIERMIAVALCRRHKHARRIKPSQGDGGLDVLVPLTGDSQFHVDNYQVKKFADKLDDSRKRQIKESLAAAIHTHNGSTYEYRIANWYLTLPMELTREQEKWLSDVADELDAPFPVKVFGLTAIEELLLDSPNIREYYLGDGMAKVAQLVSQMSTFAGLRDMVGDPTKLEPSDVTDLLANLHKHINEADPHFDYNYEVTKELPTITPGPGLIASIVARANSDAPHITWHISTKYDAALEDRPIPGSFTVYPDRMTAAQRAAWARWRKYGTPVVLKGDAVAGMQLDLPGGLANSKDGTGNVLRLGPAFGDFDDEPTTRALWLIENTEGQKLAERLFDFRVVGRGPEGGEHREGTDADRYLTIDLYTQVTSATKGTVEGGLTLHHDRWVGEPVQRLLPMFRFCAAWGNDNQVKVQDEFGLRTPALFRVISGAPPCSPVALSIVEDLVRISAATRRPISLPGDLSGLAGQDGASLHIVADVVSGLTVDMRVGEVVLWYEDHPDAFAELVERAASSQLEVPWKVPFTPFGDDFEFTFILQILGPTTVEPEEPSAGQPSSRKAARVVVDESTFGRLRLDTDPVSEDPDTDPALERQTDSEGESNSVPTHPA